MEIIEFAGEATPRSLWDLSEPDLAEICRHIAEDTDAEDTLRSEARRLFLVWTETLNACPSDSDDRERRAALLSGLRKRTIQILVGLMMPA